jgi:hypothetical protein
MFKLFAAFLALCGASWLGGGSLAAGEPDAARERARAALALARAAYPAQAPAVRGPDQAPPVREICGCTGPADCNCTGKCECESCLAGYRKALADAKEAGGYLAVWVNGKAADMEGVYTAAFHKPGAEPCVNVYHYAKGKRFLLKRLRGRCSARDVLVAVEADQLAAEMRREAKRRAR